MVSQRILAIGGLVSTATVGAGIAIGSAISEQSGHGSASAPLHPQTIQVPQSEEKDPEIAQEISDTEEETTELPTVEETPPTQDDPEPKAEENKNEEPEEEDEEEEPYTETYAYHRTPIVPKLVYPCTGTDHCDTDKIKQFAYVLENYGAESFRDPDYFTSTHTNYRNDRFPKPKDLSKYPHKKNEIRRLYDLWLKKWGCKSETVNFKYSYARDAIIGRMKQHFPGFFQDQPGLSSKS